MEADAELAYVYGVIGTFVGAKLLSLVSVLPEFIREIRYLFSDTDLFLQKYLYGGFVFYGGLYGALFAVWLYCRICRVSFSDIAGMLLPVFTLIHGFGRVGCFCMGCCYGIPCKQFGIAFEVSEIAPNNIPLFPVQLVEAGIVFILFAILTYRVLYRRDGIKSLGIYLCTYAAARFLLEFLRGDDYRGFIGSLSLSQVISVGTLILGLLILMRNRSHHNRVES